MLASVRSRSLLLQLGFAGMAALLLILTLLWHIPMMLWDHLDLVPMLDRFRQGDVDLATLLNVHGGHLHTLAYAVLLSTTFLSGGHPWLDCLSSWVLLLVYALLVIQAARKTPLLETRSGTALSLLIIFVALYPGHLANLQWGWQVAVFLCLASMAATLYLLSFSALTTLPVALALACSVAACLSFAVGAAIIPTAVVLVGLRADLTWCRRLVTAAPWLILAALYGVLSWDGRAMTIADASTYGRYIASFLGSGVSRFVTHLAPWVGAASVLTGFLAMRSARHHVGFLFWTGTFVAGFIGAALVAFGRAGDYGADHAFASRYVSFSSLYWIGWLGLAQLVILKSPLARTMQYTALGVIGTLALLNAVHLAKRASHVSARAHATTSLIRSTYPTVPRHVLGEIYFDQPAVAHERLRLLHDWGLAPFD